MPLFAVIGCEQRYSVWILRRLARARLASIADPEPEPESALGAG